MESVAKDHFIMTNRTNSDTKKNHTTFYVNDDEVSFENEGGLESIEREESDLKIPKRQDKTFNKPHGSNNKQNLVIDADQGCIELRSPSTSTAGTTVLLPNKEQFNSINDILRFPIESTHAYSYAHLSPNSLALRLNVLKRSLEILKDRPGLLKFMNLGTDKQFGKAPSRLEKPKIPNFGNRIYSNPHASNSSEFFNNSDKYKIQSNASSAALSELFRPSMKRSDSLPVNQIYATKVDAAQGAAIHIKSSARKDPIINDDFKDIITLLENDNEALTEQSFDTSALRDLSQATAKDDQKLKKSLLKNKLIYALATPFVENSSSLLGDQYSLVAPQFSASSTSLSSLSKVPSTPTTGSAANSNARPFHSISLGKHALPQSIFTVETDSPWSVKAANDLALLMFGILKNMIKSLNLMDLIAPQFREFVADKLTRSMADNILTDSKHEQGNNGRDMRDIMFAGEIVAIMRPGDKDFAWTSVWAKKRGNLIFCTFEQIPCDAFDVVILSDKGQDEAYNVDSINEVAGKLMRNVDTGKMKVLSDISESMGSDLSDRDENEEDDLIDEYLSHDIIDSEKINKTRYYTLQLKTDENIPCAVTSYPLELNDDKDEVKLKIHSLPYIGGMFVIDSLSYNIISCNNAIAKNLFGKSSIYLKNKSINNLIPDFTEILNIGLKNHGDSLDIVPGLVLPEHFFRKFDAIRRHSSYKEESEESLFFSSQGIRGLHRDGKSIWVDVQLRASSSEAFVVWITYSRLTGTKDSNISKEVEKLNSSTSSLSIKLMNDKERFKTRLLSGYRRNEVNLPSQLKLFPHDDLEILEFTPGSGDISRETSTRRPKANTFAIPISDMNKDLEKAMNLDNGNRGPLKRKRMTSNTDSSGSYVSRKSTSESATMSPDTIATTVYNDNEGTNSNAIISNETYRKYSEEEILKIEDEMLENKTKNSTHWPTVIGARRRTKKFSEFKVLKELGEGAYGKVVLAQHKEDPVYTIIIKCIDKERILVDTWVRDRKLGTICSEIQIMAFLNNEPHVNIMRIIDFFEDSKYYYLETPLFGDPPAIDLFDFIEIRKDLSERECRFIFKQIVLAIYHLHKHGIVHRDIKDENVIVDENGVVKLIDFGSAGYTKLGPFDVFVGTIDYASPEVLRGEKYEGKPQDIWALGILLYTMLYQENPFYNVDEIMEGDLRIPYVVSENSLNLIKKILVRDIKSRPTITDIVEDVWLDI